MHTHCAEVPDDDNEVHLLDASPLGYLCTKPVHTSVVAEQSEEQENVSQSVQECIW